MCSANTFTIRLATKNDLPKIIDHLRDYFYRDEPINASVCLIDSIPSNSTPEDLCLESVEDGVSFIAIDRFNQIIGVCLNEVCHRFQISQDVHLDNPTLSSIFKFLDYTHTEAQVFEKFPQIEKLLCVNIISVSALWRGNGVAERLLVETRNFSNSLGIDLIEVSCTSYFSTRLMEKLGYRSVYSMKYSDYIENGKQVFFPKYPHTEVNVMVLLL
ncbi:hypothetical protein FQR65_LT10731 [Abscondita terminalis]|nr:hypothetical protein FQR65_LT10731 [Abscondita terminalis]